MTRGGKQPGGEFVEKTAVLSTRITSDLRRSLDDAARASGRTLSQEIEARLRYSFGENPKIDRQTGVVVEIMGMVISALQNPEKPAARWFSDRYCWHQAISAAVTVLNMFRPEPEKVAPVSYTPRGAKVGKGRYQAVSFAEALVADLQTADLAVAMDMPNARHQLHMAALRERMGEDLADRPEPFGMTSEQLRRMHNIGREFGELMRRARREQVSQEDLKRIHYLAGQLQRLTAKQDNNDAAQGAEIAR
jgi:hypothetical protein